MKYRKIINWSLLLVFLSFSSAPLAKGFWKDTKKSGQKIGHSFKRLGKDIGREAKPVGAKIKHEFKKSGIKKSVKNATKATKNFFKGMK